MSHRLWLKIVLVWVLVGLGSAGFAQASEEGSVKATAAWQSEGYAFEIGYHRAFLVGVWTGILFVEAGKGSLDADSIVCPSTVEVDLETGRRVVEGRCIITDKDSNAAYARLSCIGDALNCKGQFKFTGGTGKFTGISGESTFTSRIEVRQITAFTHGEAAQHIAAGMTKWAKLNYKIP